MNDRLRATVQVRPATVSRGTAVAMSAAIGFGSMLFGVAVTAVYFSRQLADAKAAAAPSSIIIGMPPPIMPSARDSQDPLGPRDSRDPLGSREDTLGSPASSAATASPLAPPRPDQADPTKLFALARTRAPAGSQVEHIYVHYVGSNGLVDLTAANYQATITFTFRRPSIPAQQVAGAPLGVLSTVKTFPATVVRYEGTKITVSDNSIGTLGGPTADPHCTIADVWAGAIAAGAPSNAVADISFPANDFDAGRMWSFNIEGVKFHARIDDATCKTRPPSRNDFAGGALDGRF